MKKNSLLIAIIFFSSVSPGAFAQRYLYSVDLKNVVKDQVKVSLTTPPITSETAAFLFPMTIPGTYSTEDYGRYIDSLKAYDKDGFLLPVKRVGNSRFIISKSSTLSKITYRVNDTFDSKTKKNKVFEPAGTNIEADKNFIINAGGFFGYFESMEMLPFEIEFKKPGDFFGATVLREKMISNEQQVFEAADYHQLIDCPILFSIPDTTSFFIKDTRVLIAVYHQTKHGVSKQIRDALLASMDAISLFLPTLPVDNYAYIIYIGDFSEIGAEIKLGNRMKAMKLMMKANLSGLGALEHGNSSMYFLGDFGVPKMDALDMIIDVAIHEFMHIITPLSLHSQHIGNFNYTNPIMSKHLWLYEGITEYFAGLIQLRAGMITPESYLNEKLTPQYNTGKKFPISKMSFTEMSANVLKKPWSTQFDQVYQRGAVQALFLDLEIIRLTNGEKDLRDVVYGLSLKYGANKSFDEDTFIDEFVKEVHPDLRIWFAKYIEDRKDWEPGKALSTIGIRFEYEVTITQAKHPVAYAKKWDGYSDGAYTVISRISPDNRYRFKKGDRIDTNVFSKIVRDDSGNLMPEGTKIDFPFERAGRNETVEITVEYATRKTKNLFYNDPEKSAKEQANFDFWIGKSDE